VTANASAPVPVREAATVMLLRDAPGAGLEVFMLRRTQTAAFVGGFHVFPGGAVDPADGAPDMEALCDGRSDADASVALGLERGGLAYWVASLRESFEEAGLLLARDGDGKLVRFDDPAVAARFAQHRRAVHRLEASLGDVCTAEGLRLAVDGVEYVSRWVTPAGERRRFDTRFFMASAPEGQDPLHDDAETIASRWVRPADALDEFAAGTLQLIIPTIKHLDLLASFDSTQAALAGAAAIVDPEPVRPRLRRTEGRIEVVLPWEPGFEQAGLGDES
jgi:8-oxo-dGTP pyrophosphatase MutT (NUDIX family)